MSNLQYHSSTSATGTYQRHRGNAGPRVTGGRTSSIVGMLGPELLVDVPAALWDCSAQGFVAKAGTSRRATNPKTGGHRPEEWALRQETPRVLLNTAGAFSRVSLVPLWCADDCRRGLRLRGVRGRGMDPTVSCPRSLWLAYHTPSPSSRFSLLALLFPGICPRVCQRPGQKTRSAVVRFV